MPSRSAKAHPDAFPAPRPLIAVADITMSGLDAQILRGIQTFAHTKNWQIFYVDHEWTRLQLRANAPLMAGILANVVDETGAAGYRALQRPLVNVSDTFPEEFGFPAVIPDETRVGAMAASYFLDRGYRHFAVYMPPGQHPYRYIRERSRAFVETLQAQGMTCHLIRDLFDDADSRKWEAEGWSLTPMRELPQPCGVFCCDDKQATFTCFLANARGLKVPAQIAVLGVDNFELACQLSNPPLSSVDLDGFRIGQEACAELERHMLAASPLPWRMIQVPPAGVVSRASVDTAAIEDPLVAKARQYILENFHQRINVTDIVNAVGTNRRKLEILHQQAMGTTLLQSLNRARVNLARQLIGDTDLPLYQVALRCGFRDAHQMNRVFDRLLGERPTELRQSAAAAEETIQVS